LAADPSLTDEALLQRALQGHEGDFDALVRRHEDRIFSLCLRITRDRPDALDATQETFLTMFRKGHTFTGRSAFSTWLYRVAVNACNDLLRKKARGPLLELVDSQETRPEEGRPGVADEVGLRIDLRRALQELSEDYREAVVLHDLAGLPYEDIASISGVAVGTVKSRISRGRRKLAKILEQGPVAEPSKEQR
jgi:RNA polymerase sigma-70 factor (ECF subfamily)